VFILYILPCHKLPPSSEGTGLEGTQLMPCTLLWIFCWRPVLGFQIIGSPRDHHSCIIEICWKALVGEDMFKIAHPDAHRLSSSAYHSTVEYSRILTLYKVQHKLLFKSHNLYGETHAPLTQEQQPRLV
jgi:hypothetical protein